MIVFERGPKLSEKYVPWTDTFGNIKSLLWYSTPCMLSLVYLYLLMKQKFKGVLPYMPYPTNWMTIFYLS